MVLTGTFLQQPPTSKHSESPATFTPDRSRNAKRLSSSPATATRGLFQGVSSAELVELSASPRADDQRNSADDTREDEILNLMNIESVQGVETEVRIIISL